jgi:alpha-glucuronidase
MKKLIYTILIVSITSISSYGDIDKGQKLFKHHLRKSCHFSGIKFARKYTQSEWEDILDNSKFKEKTKELCPKLKLDTIKSKWWRDIYDFIHHYAKGSGNVPSC